MQGLTKKLGGPFQEKMGLGTVLFPHPPDRPRQNAGAGREAWVPSPGLTPTLTHLTQPDAASAALVTAGELTRPMPPHTTGIPGGEPPEPVGGERTGRGVGHVDAAPIPWKNPGESFVPGGKLYIWRDD